MSIVPGVTPTIWNFSVRDEAVVPKLYAGHRKARGPALQGAPRGSHRLLRLDAYYVDKVTVSE